MLIEYGYMIHNHIRSYQSLICLCPLLLSFPFSLLSFLPFFPLLSCGSFCIISKHGVRLRSHWLTSFTLPCPESQQKSMYMYIRESLLGYFLSRAFDCTESTTPCFFEHNLGSHFQSIIWANFSRDFHIVNFVS